MTGELDTFPVAELQTRYKLGKSQIYSRLDALNIRPERYSGRSYINAQQLAMMDALHRHLLSGNAIADFISKSVQSVVNRQDKSPGKTGQLAIANQNQLIAILEQLHSDQDYEQRETDVGFQSLRILDEAVLNRWWLSSSQIKRLLTVATLPKSPFQRFGFNFESVGRNGGELAWKITKAS
jgi:hypothetical protein